MMIMIVSIECRLFLIDWNNASSGSLADNIMALFAIVMPHAKKRIIQSFLIKFGTQVAGKT